MLIIDANAILRYILNDNAKMANDVCALIESKRVTIRFEVLAEVVYVLSKVYSMPRNEIASGLAIFISLPNVEPEAKNVLLFALKIFSEKSLDFVDCILCGFNVVGGCDVFTFDKKLNYTMRTLV
ncbi:MAG: PIN domain-containing protein [Oscillospiraceae bacterium]|nr:PIN domain-containing protein [Oscillospiraceae bacterium]MCL2278511.1 PIN domain-containing protein [Oscillospiraceae bacterium]